MMDKIPTYSNTHPLGLTPMQALVLTMLRESVTDMTPDALLARLPSASRDVKIVHVYICKIRKALLKHGIELPLVSPGRGYHARYQLPASTKARLNEVLGPLPILSMATAPAAEPVR